MLKEHNYEMICQYAAQLACTKSEWVNMVAFVIEFICDSGVAKNTGHICAIADRINILTTLSNRKLLSNPIYQKNIIEIFALASDIKGKSLKVCEKDTTEIELLLYNYGSKRYKELENISNTDYCLDSYWNALYNRIKHHDKKSTLVMIDHLFAQVHKNHYHDLVTRLWKLLYSFNTKYNLVNNKVLDSYNRLYEFKLSKKYVEKRLLLLKHVVCIFTSVQSIEIRVDEKFYSKISLQARALFKDILNIEDTTNEDKKVNLDYLKLYISHDE